MQNNNYKKKKTLNVSENFICNICVRNQHYTRARTAVGFKFKRVSQPTKMLNAAFNDILNNTFGVISLRKNVNIFKTPR